jgi:hypothetical protein
MMRRFVQLLILGCLLVVPAVAQRGGHGGGGFHGGFGGFHGGMGGFRGGGFGGFRGGGFGGFRGGGFVGRGFRGGFFPGGFRGFRGGWNGWGWGWGGFWPYYSAGWGYPYYGYAFDPSWGYSYPYTYTYSNPTDSTGYASRYAYGAPAYSAPIQGSCAQSNGTPLYLIKLTYQDKVWVVRDYWYTPGTLNFITLQSELNKTPIETIDRAATFQLNSQCGVNFQFQK